MTRQARGSAAAAKAISFENIDAIFRSVGHKLREGQSGEAEKILVKTIETYDHTPDNLANLKRLLAFTLETIGRYKESLETIMPFADDENISKLTPETQVKVTTQVAIAYSNTGDQPKAITLLKENRQKGEISAIWIATPGPIPGFAPPPTTHSSTLIPQRKPQKGRRK